MKHSQKEENNSAADYPKGVLVSKSAVNPQSLLWTLISVVLFVIYNQQVDKDNILGMIQISLVLICAVMALVKMVSGGKRLIYQPTNSVVTRECHYFNAALDNDIRQCLEEGNTARIKAFRTDGAGELMVEMLESKDKAFVAARLFRYESHSYEAKTGWTVMH